MANESRRGYTAYDAPPKKGRVRATGRLVIVLVVIVAVVAGILVWYFTSHKPIDEEALRAGALPSAAAQNLVSELPDTGETPDPAQFDFEINATPRFSNSIARGDLGIANPRHNYYTMHVEIVEDATGDRLYSSGTLLPGEQIEEDSLLKALSKGTHNATAHIYAYDPETREKVSNTAAGMQITVG